MLENHPCIGRADLAAKQAINPAIIALVIRPIGQLAGRWLMAQCGGTLPGQKTQQNTHRAFALGQRRTLALRVD